MPEKEFYINPGFVIRCHYSPVNDRRANEQAYFLCKKIVRNCLLDNGFQPLASQWL